MTWIKVTPRGIPIPDAGHWVNMARVAYLYRTPEHTVVCFSAAPGDLITVEETPEAIMAMGPVLQNRP